MENNLNEKEFSLLVECIASLKDIEGYFRRQQLEDKSGFKSDECELGSQRIFH